MPTLPNSVAANVGQVGGAPATQADTSAYLTQLASSLNGFTGPVSNAVNFLLNQSGLPPTAAAYGAISGINLTVGSPIAWGLGAAGCKITPGRTGRIVGIASGNWNPNMSGAGGTSASTQMYVGTLTPPAGNSSGLSPNIVSTVGFGNAVGVSQTVSSQNIWLMVFAIGFTLGLTTTTEYWVDLYSTGAGSTTGIIEFGQMLVLEI